MSDSKFNFTQVAHVAITEIDESNSIGHFILYLQVYVSYSYVYCSKIHKNLMKNLCANGNITRFKCVVCL